MLLARPASTYGANTRSNTASDDARSSEENTESMQLSLSLCKIDVSCGDRDAMSALCEAKLVDGGSTLSGLGEEEELRVARTDGATAPPVDE